MFGQHHPNQQYHQHDPQQQQGGEGDGGGVGGFNFAHQPAGWGGFGGGGGGLTSFGSPPIPSFGGTTTTNRGGGGGGFGSLPSTAGVSAPNNIPSFGGTTTTTTTNVVETTTTTWYPKNLDMSEIMKDLVEIHEGSDISFSFPNDPTCCDIVTIIGNNNLKNDHDDDDSMNQTSNSNKLLYAHKGILAHRSPQLYDMIKDASMGETIEITNTSRKVFKHLLVNAYTGVVPIQPSPSLDLEFTKDLLLVSDQYGNVNLKLSLQSLIIDHGLDTGTCSEWLLIADNYHCALLKEACFDLITQFPTEVMATLSWSAIEESTTLGFDLFKYSTLPKKKKHIQRGDYDFENWSVSQLLSKLESWGLDMDGTKTMLVNRLQEHWDNSILRASSASTGNGGGGGFSFGGIVPPFPATAPTSVSLLISRRRGVNSSNNNGRVGGN